MGGRSGTDSDSFTFANAGSMTDAVDGGPGTDTLIGDDDGNAFTISGADTGGLSGKMNGFINIENLTGGTGTESFTLEGGSIAGMISSFGNGDLLQGAGSINDGFVAGAGATVSPGLSPGIITSGNLNFQSGSQFDVDINGTIPGPDPNGHDHLNVTGTIDLGNATLNLSGTFVASRLLSWS